MKSLKFPHFKDDIPFLKLDFGSIINSSYSAYQSNKIRPSNIKEIMKI